MNKVVNFGLKIDFHIHSIASSYRDGSLVSYDTIEHLNDLVTKLKDNEVNVAAITDHDCFDLKLYDAFRNFENDGSLIKVFPGVEFSISLEDEKRNLKTIHVVAIFDDTDRNGIVRLSQILPSDKPVLKDKTPCAFKETKFIEILEKIGLDVILIAHQKKNEKSDNPQDLSSLGKNRFDEYVNIGYFNALEFKTKKDKVFHEFFKENYIEKHNNDNLKYITGSDCHDWRCYPARGDGSEKDNMQYTYLKCLPCFRGLVMAFTDSSRISYNKEFFENHHSISEINMTIQGKDYHIPLSRGVNVIIGDNSIGKSLLLHEITDYVNLDGTNGLPERLRQSYKKYLTAHGINIATKLVKGDFVFDSQGKIRHEFEDKSVKNNLIEQNYPEPPDSTEYIEFIHQQLNPFYDALQTKFDYDFSLSEFTNIDIVPIENKNNICVALPIPKNFISQESKESNTLTKIVNQIGKVETDIIGLSKLISDASELSTIATFQTFLNAIKDKYQKSENSHKLSCNVMTGINSGINNYNTRENNYFDDQTIRNQTYQKEVKNNAELIAKLLSLKKKVVCFKFSKDISKPIQVNFKQIGHIIYVTRFTNKEDRINAEYLEKLIQSVFLKEANFPDTSSITVNKLNQIIAHADEAGSKSGIDLLKDKIDAKLKEYFTIEKVLLNAKDKKEINATEYSAGYNAVNYFEALSENSDSTKIYLVDQPEDDVSQKAIYNHVVPLMRKMRQKRQIILVTHNPQFVVNLDADNVIALKKNDQGDIYVESGALEYQDGEGIDILKTVEDDLDGGRESIERRWKRYEDTKT